MGDSAAGAPFVKYKTEPLLRDDYSATFTTSLMEKDVDLVLEAAEAAGVRLPLAGEIKGSSAPRSRRGTATTTSWRSSRICRTRQEVLR